jgi:hypothetical protein
MLEEQIKALDNIMEELKNDENKKGEEDKLLIEDVKEI